MIRLFLLLLITLPVFAISSKTIEYKTSEIHVVEFNPAKYDLKIAKALDGGLGREDVLSMAKRESAIAAINGSFFDIDGRFNGLPAFLLKVKDQIFVSQNKYFVAYQDSKKHLNIKQIEAKPHITIGKTTFPCSINMPQKKSNITVYTNAYHRSTLTNPGTLEITVIDGVIVEISRKGNSKILENSFVISTHKKLPSFKLGSKVILDYGIPDDIKSQDYIMSGSDIVISNGKIIEKNNSDFYNNTYARSSICRMKNNNIALFAVEDSTNNDLKSFSLSNMLKFFIGKGYNKTEILNMNLNELYRIHTKENASKAKSVGLALVDFAAALKKYGCTDALNLDGGTSTTLVYKNKIINNISLKALEVADSIIVKAAPIFKN